MAALFSNLRRAIADPDVAIDLGTANTRLYAHGRGMVADEPSIVKIPANSAESIASDDSLADAIDESAAPTILPLHAGVVTDIDAAATLLRPLMHRARRFGLLKPRALACAPTDASEKEREALIEATQRAGASAVTLVPEPLAAALGAQLDISSPYAQMLVDIGDGVTDIAVIRSGKLLATFATRTACSNLHSAVRQMIKNSRQTAIYQTEVARLTQCIGARTDFAEELLLKARGVHCLTGAKTTVQVASQEIATVIAPVLQEIVQTICNAVRDLTPRAACEVIENGICLTGGGACLPGIETLIARKTKLDVRVAGDPMHAVINGAREILTTRMQTGYW